MEDEDVVDYIYDEWHQEYIELDEERIQELHQEFIDEYNKACEDEACWIKDWRCRR